MTTLTYAETAQVQLALFGFVGMALFGSIFYIVPRIMQRDWPSAKAVHFHFMCSAAGIVLIFAALTVAGVVQGFALNNPDPALPFINVVKSTIPFVGFATLGQLILLAAQVALLWNFMLLLREYSEPWRKSTLDLVLRDGFKKQEARS